ncbi:MAG: NosD domain-containing protein [Thermoplasmata archaeon]
MTQKLCVIIFSLTLLPGSSSMLGYGILAQAEEVQPRPVDENFYSDVGQSYQGYQEENVVLEASGILGNYTSIDPIRINNDTDFASQGFPGNGSEENPYLIQGYEIDGGGHGYSIFIGNVTEHFEVRGCHLYNASGYGVKYFRNSGLYMYNATKGNISNNIISNNIGMGIYLDNSIDNIIINNTVFSNGVHGILLESSNSNVVLNNSVEQEELPENRTEESASIEYCRDSVLVKLDVSELHVSEEMDVESALGLQASDAASFVQGRTRQIYPSLRMAEIGLEGGMAVTRAVNILKNTQGVVYAEPNYLVEVMNIPDDPGYPSLWGMEKIDAPDAWNLTTGSDEVVVAVVDTGIEYDHPDLKDNMWSSEEGYHGYNALNDSYYPMDENGHGTHVAGTIGAVGNNNTGVVGVNWNVSLMGAKFLGAMGEGTTAGAIASLEYVLERKNEGENIVATSNSWGGPGYSQLLYEAIQRHQEAGILFIAAAGNSGVNHDMDPSYPAGYDLTNIISVASTNADDELSWSSDYGARSVHVSAPGTDINSTYLDGGYRHMSGTSMATPHVSGLVALLASHDPSYDHIQLKNVVLSSADTLPSLSNLTLTEGRINAYNALTAVPDDINILVHRPFSTGWWGRETDIVVSLNDGVNPVIGANVSVDFSSDEDSVFLYDDGSGNDQVADDGYYSRIWVPGTIGEIRLTINVQVGETELTKNITVDIGGGAGIALSGAADNVLYHNFLDHQDIGVLLLNSNLNTVFNSDVTNTLIGMELHDSRNNTLSYNRVTSVNNGVSLDFSHNNTIIDNILENNGFNGIELYSSNFNTLTDNTVGNNADAVYIHESHNNTLDGNTLQENYGAVIIHESNDNIVTNNMISNNWDGIILEGSSRNHIIDNNLSSLDFGIMVSMSHHNYFHNNALSENMLGWYMIMSNGNTVQDNTIEESMYGIFMSESLENILAANHMINCGIILTGSSLEYWNSHSIDTSNTVNERPVYYWKNEAGGTVPSDAGQVILANCTGVTVEDQSISGGSVGINMGFSRENHIVNNAVNTNYFGIFIEQSNHNHISDNDISDNMIGITSGFSESNILSYNTIIENRLAVELFTSNNNTITENEVNFNEGVGITLSNSHHNIINANNASSNQQGINLFTSEKNVLINNTVSINDFNGISISTSTNNIISQNHIFSNKFSGIELSGSTFDTIKDNVLYANSIYLMFSRSTSLINNTILGGGIFLTGDLEDWDSHTIDTSNTVNERPVYYWKNEDGGTVPAGAGQVILVNCIGVTVENQYIDNSSVGILLGFSDDNLIQMNTLSNSEYGLYLYSSNGNLMINNTALNNDYGFILFESLDNIIYHNNFINNTVQAHDNIGNTWNAPYPIGGNHWSDWTEPDMYDGAGQDEPGSDGIVDEPYVIAYPIRDYYPWTIPNGWDVEGPSIALTHPLGGETFTASTEEKITWNTEEGSGNITSVTLEYSIDGGDSWVYIVQSTDDIGYYNWTVPEVSTDRGMIRATVWDDKKSTAADTSGAFEILIPEFEYWNFSLGPSPVALGENLSVSVMIKNVGQVVGTETVVLRENGVIIESVNVTITEGGNETVELIWYADSIGIYDLSVWSGKKQELKFNQLVEVVSPPTFTYNVFLSATEIEPGENITVELIVANSGGMNDTELAEFKVNGEVIEYWELTLEPREHDTIEFVWSEDEPGNYSLEIWSGVHEEVKYNETVTVLRPAEFTYSNFNVEPREVLTGEKVDINITVENIGDLTGTETVELMVDGAVVDIFEVYLDPNEFQTINFTWSENKPREYTLEIDEFETVVKVEAEEGFVLTWSWAIIIVLLIIILGVIVVLVLKSTWGKKNNFIYGNEEGVDEEGVDEEGVDEEGVDEEDVDEEGVDEGGVEEGGVEEGGVEEEGIDERDVDEEGVDETS